MNFGWNGLANGYYSLYAIVPTATGDEFGGKRYNFSYDLEAILAHPHRNNINTLPAKFRDNRIELSSYENSFIKVSDNSPLSRTKDSPLSVTLGFIANYGEDFNGKFGVAVYNDLQQVVLQAWDDQESSLPNLTLDQNPRNYSLNLSSLPDGKYSIILVAQPKPTDNSSQIVRVNKFPTLDIEVKGTNLTVFSLNTTDAQFCWESSPTATKELYPGTSATLHCAISNLTSHNQKGKVRLSLLNEKQQEIYTTETSENVLSADVFGIAIAHVPISLPQNIAPGIYAVVAKVILPPSTSQDKHPLLQFPPCQNKRWL